MENTSSSSGIGFTGLLQILFITLKLTKTVDWSWWWILSPIWISFAIAAVFVSVFTILTLKSGENKRRSNDR